MYDFSSAEPKRIQRALSKDMTPASLDKDSQTAIFLGSSGDLYRTTLDECTCTDFQMTLQRTFPCKHILRLGMELGIYPADKMKSDPESIKFRYWEILADDYIRNAPITEAMDFMALLQFFTQKGYHSLHETHTYADKTMELLLSSPYLSRRPDGTLHIAIKILSRRETLLANRIGKLCIKKRR